ncbi:MAG: hypothetical protein IT233_00220 [Bacteroidia bacterium]|nr:hypothetical protein [Bacteroidia bacterium]
MKYLAGIFLLFSLSTNAQKVAGKWLQSNDTLLVRWAVLDSILLHQMLREGAALVVYGQGGEQLSFQVRSLPLKDSAWRKQVEANPAFRFTLAVWSDPLRCTGTMLQLAASVLDRDFGCARTAGCGGIWHLPFRCLRVKLQLAGVNTELQEELPELPEPDSLITIPGADYILLKWEEPSGAKYTGYKLERKRDSGDWETAGLPLITPLRSAADTSRTVYFSDSTSVEGNYRYRVCGIDPFGRRGNFMESKTIVWKPAQHGGDLLIEEIRKDTGDVFVLKYRGGCREGNWQVFTGDSVTSQQDKKSATQCTPNEIRFTAKDPFRYVRICCGEYASFPFYYFVPDTIPPRAPGNLNGFCNRKGLVTLQWSSSGASYYRVFRANALQEEFTERSSAPVSDTLFTDTVSLFTLTTEIFYFIRAVDEHHNSSAPSDTLLVFRTDTLPPPVPSFICFETEGKYFRCGAVFSAGNSDSTFLEWENSGSRFNRFIPDSLLGKCVNDSLPQPGTYQLRFRSKDASGNQSYSETRSIQYVNRQVRLDSIKADLSLHCIHLFFRTPEDVRSVSIYRAKGSDPLSFYLSVPSQTDSWTDTQLYMGNRYSYCIMYHYKDGVRAVSPALETEY